MINGKPHIKDPLTGKFEDATKYKVAVDHILPKSYFTKLNSITQVGKPGEGKRLIVTTENI